MATYFTSAANIIASPAPGNTFGKPQVTPEQERMNKMLSAFQRGLWVVSFPYGANRNVLKADGSGETKALLRSQKGNILYNKNGGVFGVIRAEGFHIWMPNAEKEDATEAVMTGKWEYPTAHTRGEDGYDTALPGAEVSGFHKLILNLRRDELTNLATEMETLGDAAGAKASREAAKSFRLPDVWGNELAFNLPMGVAELQGLKATAAAQVAMGGGQTIEGNGGKLKSPMAFSMILGVQFRFLSTGEVKMQVVEIIDSAAPLLTISNQEGLVSQNKLWAAMNRVEVAEEAKEEKLERLHQKADAIIATSGKAAKNRKQGKEIEILAKQVGCDYNTLKTALQTLGGHLGTPEGMRKHGKDVTFLKAYILSNGNGAASPEVSVTAGATVEAETTEEPQTTNMFAGATTDAEEIEASDIDII